VAASSPVVLVPVAGWHVRRRSRLADVMKGLPWPTSISTRMMARDTPEMIAIELARVQAHQVGWIDVVDADDLKRSYFGKGFGLCDGLNSVDPLPARAVHAGQHHATGPNPCCQSGPKPHRPSVKRPYRRQRRTAIVVGSGRRKLRLCVHQTLHDRLHGGLVRSRYDCPFGPHPTLVCGDHLAAERQVGESASPRLNVPRSIDQNEPEIEILADDL